MPLNIITMQILGNRVLVRKLVEEVKEGFQTVDVNDPFLNKGVVEAVGDKINYHPTSYTTGESKLLGATILFAKYSPDTHDFEDKKIVSVDDILAIL